MIRLEIAVVPIAIGAGAFADFLIVVAFAVVATMILSAGIWGGQYAKAALGGLPIVGGTIANVAQSLIDVQVNLLYAIESQLAGSIYWGGRAFGALLRIMVGPFFAPRDAYVNVIANDVGAVTHLAQTIWYESLPQIGHAIAGIASEVAAVTQLAQHIWFVELPKIWQFETDAARDIAAVTQLAQFIYFTELPRLAAIESQLDLRLRELEAYLDILRRLAGFETTVEGGIAGLRTGVQGIEQALQAQGADLAKLLPLIAVLAVSGTAIENLTRLAENPCFCLDFPPWIDMPQRVAALQGIGN
jgi:hypothetical protein